MKKVLAILTASILAAHFAGAQPLNNTRVDGYRGIWFTLGQESSYGYKYSGGFGTYTMKHIPLAIYSPETDKTFFVYGGTTDKGDRHLLCMAGCFDHKTGLLQKPTVVFDKESVNDPHDNPSLQIDKDGYLWVFVSGRSKKRPGHIYKSDKPFDITSFHHIKSWEMTYPQPIYDPKRGFFLNFTQYTGVRRLYWSTSKDGTEWSEIKNLANIITPGDTKSGHYEITGYDPVTGKIVVTFNRHKNGDCDTRTNIYYLESSDWGKTWKTASGKKVETPVTTLDSPALILDAQSKGQNVYIKDVNFDSKGRAVVLFVTSYGHKPGPKYGPRQWSVARWTGKEWEFHDITTSTHNYDSGSIWVEDGEWTVIAPTGKGPQLWQTGGEVEMWKSYDKGATWTKIKELTEDSRYNMGYCRRPLHAADGFYCFWSDGNPERLTQSHLYFCDREGNVFIMPYKFSDEWTRPIPLAEAGKEFAVYNKK